MAKAAKPPVTSSNVVVGAEFKSHRRLFVIIAVTFLLLVGAVVTFVVTQRKTNSPATKNTNQPVISAVPLSSDEVKANLNRIAASGKIMSVNNNTLTLTGNSQPFTLTASTQISHGVEHVKATIADLKPGMTVSLSYDKTKNEVLEIWYE